MLFVKEISKEQLNELPLIKYEGKVEVVDSPSRLNKALEEIRAFDAVGFDTESKPTFRKGEYNHVSLIQFAVPEKVYLVRINKTGFTTQLQSFFSEKHPLKVGISIRDDIKDLQKLAYFTPGSVIDLNTVAKTLEVQHAGVRKLTAVFLKGRVSKTQQTTNWERDQLTSRQIRYAATDAWVCLEIYHKLQQWGYL